MSETYPRKNLCETLFTGHTPFSVGIGAKVQQNLRLCKFCVEKVLGVFNILRIIGRIIIR